VKTYALAGGGYVKIGRSARLLGRVQDVQQGVPFDLEMIGHVREDIEAEVLAALRMLGAHARGEWFHDTPAVRRELRLRGFFDAYDADLRQLAAHAPRKE
jgi:hypothetical protein